MTSNKASRGMVWFSIVMSTVIYLGMLIYMAPETGDFEALAQRNDVRVLYVVAFAAFLAGWFAVPRIVTKDARTKMIVALAVFEACAIFGLIAGFITKDWRLYLGPWALALIGFAREFPRAEIGEGRAPM